MYSLTTMTQCKHPAKTSKAVVILAVLPRRWEDRVKSSLSRGWSYLCPRSCGPSDELLVSLVAFRRA
jgi:hypothetical protein